MHQRLLFAIVIFLQVAGCQLENTKEHSMFEWIKSLNHCPTIDQSRYPEHDPEAESIFQRAYAADDVVPRTMPQEEVVRLYQQAAEMGHWVAMHNLAISYYEGYGIEEDEAKALYWYKQIEALDIAEGYTDMALVYRNGIGVKKNENKSLEYTDRAAQLGDPDAQFMLGKYLYDPLRRKPDAYTMLTCAMEQGHREATFELALHHEVDENVEKAYQTYRIGAKLGSISCINTLRHAFAHQPKYETFGLMEDQERSACLYGLVKELRENSKLSFPDLDDHCPANVRQPPDRD